MPIRKQQKEDPWQKLADIHCSGKSIKEWLLYIDQLDAAHRENRAGPGYSKNRRSALKAIAAIGPTILDILFPLCHYRYAPHYYILPDIWSYLGKGGIPYIENRLEQHMDDPYVVSCLLKSMRLMGNQALPYLTKYLRHDNAMYRDFAAEQIGELGPKAKAAIPALKKSLFEFPSRFETATSASVSALMKVTESSKEKTDLLLKVIKQGPSPANCWIAIHYLGDIKPSNKRIIDKLIKILSSNEERWNYRAAAAESISKIGPTAKRSIPVLRSIIREKAKWVDIGSYNSQCSCRFASIRALKKMGTSAKSAIPDLVSLLQTERRNLYREIVDALKAVRANPKRVLPIYMKLAESRSQYRQKAGLTGIASIGSRAAPAVPLILHCMKKMNDTTEYLLMKTLAIIGRSSNLLLRYADLIDDLALSILPADTYKHAQMILDDSGTIPDWDKVRNFAKECDGPIGYLVLLRATVISGERATGWIPYDSSLHQKPLNVTLDLLDEKISFDRAKHKLVRLEARSKNQH